MKVKLSDASPASISEIREFEVNFGRQISSQFKSFLLMHNGSVPEQNVIMLDGEPEIDVERFLLLSEILFDKHSIEGTFPRFSYPIAYDAFGNYYIIDESRLSSVYIWWHEEDQLQFLADDFDSFLELMQPDDFDVEIDWENTGPVWVDHDFLRELNEQGELTLHLITNHLKAFDPEACLYAAKPWEPMSNAYVARSPRSGSDATRRMSPLIKVSTASALLEAFEKSLGRRPNDRAKCLHVIEYAVANT